MTKYNIKEIMPQVFLLTFNNRFDLTFHFLHLQEYYENPNPQFNRKLFDTFDFIEWYSKEQNKEGSFTYPEDFVGFNVPGNIINEFYDKFLWNYGNKTKYDYEMEKISNSIRSQYGNDYYLIGILENDKETIDHELSHALWYLNPEYKKEMTSLLAKLQLPKINIPYEALLIMDDWLEKNMYHRDVFDDEIVAYFSTGLVETQKSKFKKKKIKIKPITKPFKEVFEKYKKQALIV